MAEKSNKGNRLGLTLLGVFGIILVAVVDYVTGPDVLINIFYVGPVILLARAWGVRGGVLAAIASILASLATDAAWFHAGRLGWGLVLWNAGARLSMLLLVAMLYGKLLAVSEAASAKAALFQAVVESSAEAIAISDPAGRFVYANPAYERLFGWPLLEITGQPIRNFLAAQSPGSANGGFLTARERREPWVGEVHALDASGRTFPLWVRGDYVRDSKGDVRYGFGLMHDVSDERRVQEELRESRILLEHALDQALLAYWEMDTETQTFTFNDRFYRLYGTTAEREGGYRMSRGLFEREFSLDGESPIVQAEVARLLSGEMKELRFEHQIRRRDGEIRHIRTVVDAVRDGMGKIVGAHGSNQDVTDLRRAEAALQATVDRLQESEQRFVSMAANSPAVIYRFSNRRGGLYFSPRTIEMFGVSPEALMADPHVWQRLIHPDDLAKVNAVSAMLRSTEGQQGVDYRIRRPDRRERWLRVRATSHAQPGGELITDGLVLDVTDVHHAEGALREANALLASVVESTGDIIAMLDTTHRYVFFNRAFHEECKKIFGKDLKRGDRMADMMAGVPEDLANALAYWNRALGGESFTVTQQFGDATLERRWYALQFNPVKNAAGEVVGAVHVVHDVSQEKHAEESVARSLLEKETLLREIHHRVKNNMQVISSMLDLQREQSSDASLKEAFLVAEERVKAMALLHERLYRAPDVANIDFADYVRELAAESQLAHGVGPPRIAVRVEGRGVRLALDKAVPCALAVNELLTNAIKYAFPGGRCGEINIVLKSHAGRLVVTVRDNGAGIPPGVDPAKTGSLGLRLVDVLAHQLHGTFRLSNEGGVSAELSFPLDEATW